MSETSKPAKRKRLQRVSIRAEHRDKPDWDRFAFALLQYTKTLSKEPLEPRVEKGRRSP